MTNLVLDHIEETDDETIFHMTANEVPRVGVLISIFRQDIDDFPFGEAGRLDLPFTKSSGTILSRLYERLTRASRRTAAEWPDDEVTYQREHFYRKGVYDAYSALQDEMAGN